MATLKTNYADGVTPWASGTSGGTAGANAFAGQTNTNTGKITTNSTSITNVSSSVVAHTHTGGSSAALPQYLRDDSGSSYLIKCGTGVFTFGAYTPVGYAVGHGTTVNNYKSIQIIPLRSGSDLTGGALNIWVYSTGATLFRVHFHQESNFANGKASKAGIRRT